MFPSLVKKNSFTKAKRMGAEASSSLMTFSTHLLALEPDYDNEKYKASLSHSFWFQRNLSVIIGTMPTIY